MIKKITVKDLPARQCPSRITRIEDVESFLASGDPVCECILVGQEKPKNVWAAYYNAIKSRPHYSDVGVMGRQGRIFLYRKTEVPNE